jgi:hypothetical protein
LLGDGHAWILLIHDSHEPANLVPIVKIRHMSYSYSTDTFKTELEYLQEIVNSQPANSETIFLKATSLTELRQICMSFKTGKAPGYDNIPMHLIKNYFQFIIHPLMHLINISLETGVFPDKLKMAKIIPIFKADDPQLFKIYRPISLLTNFSKFY